MSEGIRDEMEHGIQFCWTFNVGYKLTSGWASSLQTKSKAHLRTIAWMKGVLVGGSAVSKEGSYRRVEEWGKNLERRWPLEQCGLVASPVNKKIRWNLFFPNLQRKGHERQRMHLEL